MKKLNSQLCNQLRNHLTSQIKVPVNNSRSDRQLDRILRIQLMIQFDSVRIQLNDQLYNQLQLQAL